MQRIGFGELTGGIDGTHDYVEHGFCTGLTAEVCVYDCSAVFVPVHLDCGTAGNNGNNGSTGLCQCFNEFNLACGQVDVFSVQALGFGNFVQADIYQGNVCLLCQFASFCYQFRALLAVTVEALCIAYGVDAAFFQNAKGRIQTGGVNNRGACALITGFFCKVADDGYFGLSVQGENAVFVLQEDNRFLCCAQCNGVVLEFVEYNLMVVCLVGSCLIGAFGNGFSVVVNFFGGEDELEESVEVFVQNRFGNDFALSVSFVEGFLRHGAGFYLFFVFFILLNSSFDVEVGVAVGAGHFQFVAGDQTGNTEVFTCPVGNDYVLIAPFLTQDVLHEVHVFVGVLAVEHIVRGHDALGAAFFYSHFKGSEVNFTHGSFVYDSVDNHTAFFLVVQSKVLNASRNTVGLNTADVCGGHLTCEIRIFGEVLEVSAATRVTLHVRSGTEQYVYL